MNKPNDIQALTSTQLGHIKSLYDFLLSIHQVYLQIGNSRSQSRNIHSSNHGGHGIVNRNNVSSLTDTERDEIDFETKTIIRQTMNQLDNMQRIEKGLSYCDSANN
jgi:hypothetical protein